MKKIITIYELLGLIKNNKAPKKIKFCGNIYEWEDDWYLTKEKNYKVCLGGKKEDCNILINAFNDNVEILDEEEFEDIKCLENEKEFYAYTGYENYKNDIDKIIYILKAINITEEKIDNLNNQTNQLIKNQKKIIEKLKGKNE